MKTELPWRLGVVVIPRTKSGEIITIPVSERDGKKSERIWPGDGEYESLKGKRQFLGGGVKPVDILESDFRWEGLFFVAIGRELLEEGQLQVSYSTGQLQEMSGTYAVEQIGRESGDARFVVAMFVMTLSQLQENKLAELHGQPLYDLSQLRVRDRWIAENYLPISVPALIQEDATV